MPSFMVELTAFPFAKKKTILWQCVRRKWHSIYTRTKDKIQKTVLDLLEAWRFNFV